MSAKDKKLLVGVDFGATKILAAVFSPKLKLLGQEKKKTEADQGVGGTIRKIAKAIREALIEADSRLEDVAAIGIGAPAPVDPKKGLIIDAPNLGWKNVPLRDELEKVLKVPVFVENDVNVGTLGVQQCGAARGARSVVGIFVGTGVGGGIVLDGEIFSGAGHMAGEIGHMIVDPSSRHKEATGMAGTLEALASRLSINRQIRQAVSRGQPSILRQINEGDLRWVRSGALRAAVKRKDRVATRVLERACEHIGIGVANVISLLNPEVVVIGGGVFEALGDFMLPRIRKSAKAHLFGPLAKNVNIVANDLGDAAGILGAAVYAGRSVGFYK